MKRFPKKQRVLAKGFVCSLLLLTFIIFILFAVLRECGRQEENGRESDGESEMHHPKEMKMIRVIIMDSNRGSIFHDAIALLGESSMTLTCVEEGQHDVTVIPEGKEIVIDRESPWLGEKGRLEIECEKGIRVNHLIREFGVPTYQGRMEVQRTPEGFILIHVAELEEYLCGVVPSEMPASYPEEALEAQAICARTYACEKMMNAGYPEYGAHLDDSVSYQAYQKQARDPRTTLAVRATEGLILSKGDGMPAETFYYSTSCGRGTDPGTWKTGEGDGIGTWLINGKHIGRAAMETFLGGGEDCVLDRDASFLLEENADDYEREEAWYRWSYEVETLDVGEMKKRIRECIGDREVEFQTVRSLNIIRRGPGGVAETLEILTDLERIEIWGGNQIRKVLCDGKSQVADKNGKRTVFGEMLPSAFIILNTSILDGNVIGYSICGGGFGHGVGMSQNAAKNMAMEGKTAAEILGFFYEDCVLAQIP